MRLVATDAELDCNIANIALNEAGNCLDLGERRGCRCRQRRDLVADLGRRASAIAHQFEVPVAEIPPVGPTRGLTVDLSYRYHHVRRDALPGRHLLLDGDGREIGENPL